MTRFTRSLIATLLSLSFISMPTPPAKACAPDLAYAILINGNHPDLPLKLFAGGNIGIVQPGWAKSYLVVAYRLLSGKPLSKLEQNSIVNLWHERIKNGSRFDTSIFHDPKDDYMALRCKAIGDTKKNTDELSWKMDSYVYEFSISDSSFQLAKETLANILKKYPPKAQQVRDWVKAQDGIFGIGTAKVTIPPALPPSTDGLLQDARTYQIAAGNFYSKRFDKAASLFQALADKPNSSLSKIASYMVLRSKSNEILRGKGTGDAEAVSAQIQKAADQATKASEREQILDLLRPISYLNHSAPEVVKLLATMINDGSSKRFGSDVGDLTFLLDGNAPLCGLDVQGPTTSLPASTASLANSSGAGDGSSSNSNDSDYPHPAPDVLTAHDIADFVCTVQRTSFLDWSNTDEERKKAREEGLRVAKHAREMWSKKKNDVWLVAALSGLGVRLQDDKELYDAAIKTPESSPAFLTCRFYVIDSLISQGKREEARKLLTPIMAATNLPPSSRNLFSMQMAAASSSISDYLKYSVINPPEILQSNNDLVSSKFYKLEGANVYQTEAPGLDKDCALDLSRNAPMSTWMKFAQSQPASSKFKAVAVRSAWTRAQILQKEADAAKLENDLAATNPTLAAAVTKIKNAPAGPAKQFAVACLVLRNYGMTPYLRGGTERHGEPIGEFDYYNNNFWVPLPVNEPKGDDAISYAYNDFVGYVGDAEVTSKVKTYFQPGVSRLLSEAEKNSAVAERALMLKNHPSRFFGQTVLDWAKTHPKDPDVPEMLYRIVKLPKWSEQTPVGSEFSKKAYFALHKGYPGNPWTKKAVCYY